MAVTLYANLERITSIPYFEKALQNTKGTIPGIYFLFANVDVTMQQLNSLVIEQLNLK